MQHTIRAGLWLVGTALVASCGGARGSGGRGAAPEAVDGDENGPADAEPTTATDAAAAEGLSLSLACANPEVRPGESIDLTIVVSNRGSTDVVVDNGSLVVYPTFGTDDGTNLVEWPYMDILAVGPGREAYWTVTARGSTNLSRKVALERGEWSGFGIPGGRYKGLALVVSAAAGSAIYAVPSLPRTVFVTEHWLADSDTVRSRAETFGMSDVFAGTLESNPVRVELVER